MSKTTKNNGEALKREERARAILQAAIGDERLMKDVREAQRLEASGDEGEPLAAVKARLGLV